jgi:hypothetical protein
MHIYRLLKGADEEETHVSPIEIRDGDVIEVRDHGWRVVATDPGDERHEATLHIEPVDRRPA